MRKITLVTLALVTLAFKKDDLQADLQKAVIKHIKETADDPNGFESIKFGKAEKFFTRFEMTDRYQELMARKNQLWEKSRSSSDQGFTETAHGYRMDAVKVAHEMDSLAAVFPSTQFGWKIYHKYRLKDGLGLLKLREDTFYTDMKLSVVDPKEIMLSTGGRRNRL